MNAGAEAIACRPGPSRQIFFMRASRRRRDPPDASLQTPRATPSAGSALTLHTLFGRFGRLGPVGAGGEQPRGFGGIRGRRRHARAPYM